MSDHCRFLRKLLFRSLFVGLTASLLPTIGHADVLALDWSYLSAAY